jgi:aminopeptidase N
MIKFFFLIALFLVTSKTYSQSEESCFDMKQLVESEKSRFESKRNFRRTANTSNYDLSYSRLALKLDLSGSGNAITGLVTHYFIAQENNFSKIIFELDTHLTVKAIISKGQPLTYTHLNNIITVNLADTMQSGVMDSLSIDYYGNPSSTGHGSFTIDQHNGTPVLWTLSEPYGSRDWWPCKQDLTDKIDSVDIIITTAPNYKTASNGVLAYTKSDLDGSTYCWKHRYPIATYLVGIAVTNYTEFSDYVTLSNGDSLEILNYVYPEHLSSAQVDLKETISIMKYFDDVFGTYPFEKEKYGHADFGWGGGMEHQTMSFMGSYSYELIAHELAHQWFGNKITCNTWGDLWLNEGFATYATGLIYEKNAVAYWLPFKEIMMDKSKINNDLSVFIQDTTDVQRMFNENTYYKGAALLHMLRWIVGDSLFFTALKNYSTDPILSYSMATTDLVKSHFENVIGENLDEFFSDWCYGKGYPTYQFLWNFKDDQFHLKASQTTSNAEVPFFEMPIPIHVYGEGQDSLLKLDHTFSGQLFSIPLPFEVDSIAFNSELHLLTGNATNQKDILLTNLELQKDQFSIQPNPASSHFVINHSCGSCDKKISCTNEIGELIYEFSSSSTRDMVEITSWSTGTYVIKIQSEHDVQSTLLIKQ